MLVVYEYDSNFIHVKPMKNKSGPEILAAYQRAHKMFTERGLRPLLQKLDNEASDALQQFMTAEGVDYQLVPPHIHRRNAAERAIRTFKNHFVAILSSTDLQFPLNLWDKMLPQALLTLNLLRGSRINPNLSAWAQVHGAFDYNRTPLAPFGTRVLVHEKPSVRATWAPHAVEGWYLGPAMNHYRCYRVWITETSAERVSETVVWLPSKVKMPTASSADAATAAARDLIQALRNPAPTSPLSPTSDSQLAALQQLADIFANVAHADATPTTTTKAAPTPQAPPGFLPHSTTPPARPPVTFSTAPDPVQLPRVAQPITEASPTDSASVPRVATPAAVPNTQIAPLVSALKSSPRFLATSPLTTQADNETPTSGMDGKNVTDVDGFTMVTYRDKTTNQAKRRRQIKAIAAADQVAIQAAKEATEKAERKRKKTAKAAAAAKRKADRDSADAAKAERERAAKAKQRDERPTAEHTHGTRARKRFKPKGGLVATTNSANCVSFIYQTATAQPQVNIDPTSLPPHAFWTANAVIDPITGASLEYRHLRVGPDGEQWMKAAADEIGRLAQGVLPNMPKGTNTMHFIKHTDMPKGRSATYLRIVAAKRPNKA